MISDEYGSTVNGIIRGNTINNVGDDAIAVYGNHSNLLIDSNRISRSAKRFCRYCNQLSAERSADSC